MHVRSIAYRDAKRCQPRPQTFCKLTAPPLNLAPRAATEMKRVQEKPPGGLTFGGYVHRNMAGTAGGFSQTGHPPMGRNVNLNYAQRMLRLRPSNDLHLDVLGLPNAGAPHPPTVPRQRPQTQCVHSRPHTLAYSDSHAIDAIRSSTRGSQREHARSRTVDERLLASTKGEEKTAKTPHKLDPLPKRPPSSSVGTRKREVSARKVSIGALPPIEGEIDAEAEKMVSRLEENDESSSDTSSESEDEVRNPYWSALQVGFPAE